MKLRIKGSSLRLRLTQGEVRQLQDSGAVSEEVRFDGARTLGYRVMTSSEVSDITVSYDHNLIEIRLPRARAQRWISTDEVTLSHEQPNGAGTLRIVIEKDWACLAPREGEDESDNFPHPETGAKSC